MAGRMVRRADGRYQYALTITDEMAHVSGSTSTVPRRGRHGERPTRPPSGLRPDHPFATPGELSRNG